MNGETGQPERVPGRLSLPDFRGILGRPLRVGGIDYLNSRPLLEGLHRTLGPQIELLNRSPGELARRLRAGELDVALVPVVEYFQGPADYRVIPGVSIASYGAVESIRLFHRGALSALGRVGLDCSSMTSQILLKLLFAANWAVGKPPPEFNSIKPEDALLAIAAERSDFDGLLLIGDAALELGEAEGWSVVDLGTEWTRWTGLPFVYAFWVYRGPDIPGLTRAFQRSRDLGWARIDAIVERGPLPASLNESGARGYLHRAIQYELRSAEIEGLLLFRDRARESGLLQLNGSGELRFLETESETGSETGSETEGGSVNGPDS